MTCKYCGKEVPEEFEGKQCPRCYADMEGELPYTAVPTVAKTAAKTEKKGEK